MINRTEHSPVIYSSRETSFGLLIASTSRSKVEDVDGFLSVLLPPPLIALDKLVAFSKMFKVPSMIAGASVKSEIRPPPRILAANDLASDNSSKDPSSTGLNNSSKNWSTSEAVRKGKKDLHFESFNQTKFHIPCDGTLTRRTCDASDGASLVSDIADDLVAYSDRSIYLLECEPAERRPAY